jgi:hypothetical protein
MLPVNPPGSDVLSTPCSFISFAYLVAGITVGFVLLAASSRFRQIEPHWVGWRLCGAQTVVEVRAR